MKLGIAIAFTLMMSPADQPPRSQASRSFNGFDLVDKAGNIIRKPNDYRDNYEILGVFGVNPVPMVGGSGPEKGTEELHFTYASPGTAEYYRKTGKFPDGAVLVKEVFTTDQGRLTTGDVHWASKTKLWFVMIKDEKGRFPKNPLWAEGWGWALFKSDAPEKQIATAFTKDCQGCHLPASSTDWIYIQGYPVLTSK